MTCCKVPKCDVIALQEMYDIARKIENILVIYWCLSRNDKKVTDFRKDMQRVQDVGLYLMLVSFATGVYGCSRECGATDRVGGRGGGSAHSYSQPKIVTLSHIFSPSGEIRFLRVSPYPENCGAQQPEWRSPAVNMGFEPPLTGDTDTTNQTETKPKPNAGPLRVSKWQTKGIQPLVKMNFNFQNFGCIVCWRFISSVICLMF